MPLQIDRITHTSRTKISVNVLDKTEAPLTGIFNNLIRKGIALQQRNRPMARPNALLYLKGNTRGISIEWLHYECP